MRDHLVVYINGAPHVVAGEDAFLPLAEYLRRRLALVGTKIVCSEGDCGACTVLIGRPPQGCLATPAADADASRQPRRRPRATSAPPAAGLAFRYQAVDSCIQFMFQLDGAHVVTVEGLRPDGRLNGVQQAMVDGHGSQCGFCTPGFVMTMTGLLETHDALDPPALCSGLTGNLCRCTGYTSIIESGVRAAAAAEHPRLNDLYPPGPMIAELQQHGPSPVTLRMERFGAAHLAACPVTLAGALESLAEHPAATIVAGASDVGVRINKTGQLPAAILDLNQVAELDYIRHDGNALLAGARTTWSALHTACGLAPELQRIISLFGAPQIRHIGTIAGNIANASPIADSLPFLFVMEATLTLQSLGASREVNINDFYRGYKQLDLRPGELISAVRIPLPAEGDLVRLYKVSRRRDLDIAGLTAAIRLRLAGPLIDRASIALGAVGPTVLRPRGAEEFLQGRPFTEQSLQAAGELAAREATPITDVRGTADYRRQLIRNVFRKFYHQEEGGRGKAEGGRGKGDSG